MQMLSGLSGRGAGRGRGGPAGEDDDLNAGAGRGGLPAVGRGNYGGELPQPRGGGDVRGNRNSIGGGRGRGRGGDGDDFRGRRGSDPPPVNVTDDQWQLYDACQTNNLERVRELMAEGRASAVHIHGDSGTPMQPVVVHGFLDIAKLLIETYKVPVNAPVSDEDNGSDTPLCLACTHGQLEMVKYLLDQGANIEQADGTEDFPLGCAVRRCRVDIARLLIERGADKQRLLNGEPLRAWAERIHATVAGRNEMIALMQ